MTTKNLILFFLLWTSATISLYAQPRHTGVGIAAYSGEIPAEVPEAWPSDPFFLLGLAHFECVHAALQPDQSVVVWGTAYKERVNRNLDHENQGATSFIERNELFSIRFTPNGLLDTTYGLRGWVNYALPPSLNERMSNIKIAPYPDGRCLVVADMNQQKDILAMRFQPDGRPDSTFREIGYVWFTADLSTRDRLLDLALLPNGKARMLLSSDYSTFVSDCRIVQLDTKGHRDTLFDVDGVLTILDRAGTFEGQFLPDGRALVVDYNMDWLKLYRYLPDGSPDYAFGHLGTVNTRIESIYDDFISTWPDGSFLIYGQESRFCETGKPEKVFNLLRYNTYGRLDTTFEWSGHNNGWPKTDYLRNLTILSDTTFSAWRVGANDGELLQYTASGQSQHILTRRSDKYRNHWKVIPIALDQQLLIGTDQEKIIALRLLPAGKPDPAYGLDSLDLRKAGYFFKKEKKASSLGFDLHVAPESIPPSPFSDLVLLDSSAFVLEPLPFYFDKFKGAATPHAVASIKQAVQEGLAGKNIHLKLTNQVLSARMPELANIPADFLKGLSLVNCRLDKIPAELRRFAGLEVLEIRYDPDSTALLPAAKRLNALLALFPNLEILILALPGVSEAPKGLKNFKNLMLLDLDLPGLKVFPEAITHLKPLTELHLRNVVQPVAIPASIGDLTNLEVLSVSGTGFTAFPDSLARCVQLREINVLTTGTFAAFPNDLLALPNLEQFGLEICQPSPELKAQGWELREISKRKGKWSYFRM
ncbi:MAG: hypothetical protein HUU01_10510 [Saprospiraceae bacterium]|nr:hypothetical protein [Saprospiraceae bacterium]